MVQGLGFRGFGGFGVPLKGTIRVPLKGSIGVQGLGVWALSFSGGV